MRVRLLPLIAVGSLMVACQETPPAGGTGAPDAASVQADAAAELVDSGVAATNDDAGANAGDGAVSPPDAAEDAGAQNDANVQDDAGDAPDAPIGTDAGVSADADSADSGAIAPDASGDTGPDATVDAGPPAPDGGVLMITPTSASVPLGDTLDFTLTASAGAQPVWAVNGVAGGATATGTIAAQPDARQARYTAPRQVSVLGMQRITATLGGAAGVANVSLVNPAPTIATISPEQVPAGAAATTFSLTGDGFTASSRVDIEGITVSSTLIDFNRIDFTAPAGLLALAGPQRVTVTNSTPGGGVAATQLFVVFVQTIVSGTLAASIPQLFESAMAGVDPTRSPAITYPENEAVAPRDFPAPRISWQRPAPSNICRLRISNPAVQVDVFSDGRVPLPPNTNTSTAVTSSIWSTITNAGFDRLNLDLTVACAEVISAGGAAPTIADGRIYTSPTVRYVVSRTSAGGRIVYFSGLIEGMWRIDIGGADAVGTPWIGPDPGFATETPLCVGCHSFNRNGRSMAYISNAVVWNLGIANIINQTPNVVLDPVNGAVGNWTSIHPTRDLVLSIDLMPNLTLLNATTGQQVMTVPTGAAGPRTSQPTWSPRGDRVAFVTGDVGVNGVADIANGRIWTMTASVGVTGNPTFGVPMLMAGPQTAGGSAYYPFYSPDGEWIVYAQAPTGSSYNNPQGNLWLIKADGTAGPIALGNANQAAGLANSWPRWAPSSQSGRYWIVFSSQRPYAPFNGTGPQQLWVTRIDTSALPADPSSPAIWLSGQEPFTGNLTGEWTVDL